MYTSIMSLPPLTRQFVSHFGEMGSRWGINRTVGQIYALIFVAERALNADEIAEQLEFSRSNVSMGLKELQSWGLVQIVHLLGDRRDHFEARKDLWEMVTAIVEERKKREIDPTLSVLRQCVAEAAEDRKTEPETKARMQNMLEFLELVSNWHTELKQLPRPTLVKLMKLGAKVAKFLGGSA